MEDKFLLQLSVLPRWRERPQTTMCFLRKVGEVECRCINSISHYYHLIHSDEGLTLETWVVKSFTVANLPYQPCG